MGVPVKRIAVIGMGIVSPLSCGVQHVWQSPLAGKSGITRLSEQPITDIPCKVAGQVPSIDNDPLHGFNLLATTPVGERKKMDRFIGLALTAAREVLVQAGWSPASEAERGRTATMIATGIGGFSEIASAVHTTDERRPRRLSPFTIPSFLVNLAAGHVSIAHGFRGLIGASVTACVAGAQVIGDTARMIRSGEVDIALCGDAEAAIHCVSLAGFVAVRALSSASSDQPEAASCPLDRDRDGFVMGEGTGLIVIESLEHALVHGAVPLAELVGYGTSVDAYHLAVGPENGNGARRVMETVIHQAGVIADEIDHINAHATSTQVDDKGELAAIKALFGAHPIVITSTKSATGHLLGAAGGVEVIFTIQVLRDRVVPPMLNLHYPDEETVGLNLVALQARPQKMYYALPSGFDFGGANASLLLRCWE